MVREWHKYFVILAEFLQDFSCRKCNYRTHAWLYFCLICIRPACIKISCIKLTKDNFKKIIIKGRLQEVLRAFTKKVLPDNTARTHRNLDYVYKIMNGWNTTTRTNITLLGIIYFLVSPLLIFIDYLLHSNKYVYTERITKI